MPVEQRGQVIAVEHGPTGSNREEPEGSAGRRQPSRGDTSRMNREVQVRICEGLGAKLPGPTRQSDPKQSLVAPAVNDFWKVPPVMISFYIMQPG